MSNPSVALQRIFKIADEGSFVPLWSSAEGSGAVTGYGSIAGRPAYFFAQDPGEKNGSIGCMQAEKIVKLYRMAVRTSTPVIGLVDCSGIRAEEGAEALRAVGEVLKEQTKAKAVIPQIFAVFGSCGGSMAISAGLADFVFSTDKSNIFVNPAAAREYTGPRAKISDALKASPAAEALSCLKGNEAEVLEAVKQLYDYLPLSDLYEAPVYEGTDDMNRLCCGIDSAQCPAARLKMVADEGKFVMVKHISETAVMGFARINGRVTACMGGKGTDLCASAVDAMTEFVEFASDYGIPLLNMVNYGGFSAKEGEEALLPASAARLSGALITADIPKVSVVCGMAEGSISNLFANSTLAQDVVFAWKGSKLQMLDKSFGMRILGCSAEEYEELCGTDAFLKKAYIDNVIAPEDTRKYVIGAFQMLQDRAEL